MAKKSKNTLNKKKKNPKLVFLIVAGVFILAMVLLFILDKAPSDTETAIDFDLTGQPSLGNDDAPVKLVEFGDYKCIYCKNFEENIFPQIKKDYIDTGKVEFHFINKVVISYDSNYAAIVGDGIYKQNPEAFWKYYQLVYENQGPEEEEWATMDYLINLVKENLPEVDLEKLAKDVSSEDITTLLAADNKLAEQANITSTPTLFINGVEVKDAFNYDQIKDMIDKALK